MKTLCRGFKYQVSSSQINFYGFCGVFCNSRGFASAQLFGAPQGSILGPLLFNIFLCDLFLFIKYKDVASYADDTTPYETGGNSAFVIHNLEVLGNTLLKWFNDNSMKANPGKYHLLSGSDSSKITIGNKTISSRKCEKHLGIKIDNNLNFKNALNLCVKKQVKKSMLFQDFHHQ